MKSWTASTIMSQLKAGDQLTVEIREGERAWNPACTTCMIHGPAKIHYRRYLDGGVDATVHELKSEI
jgi:hypothetical protein